MTVADRITAVMSEHGAGFRYDSQNYLCTAKACDGLRFRDEDEHAAHVTAAVLAELEKTHAIVELPEPDDGPDGEGQFTWRADMVTTITARPGGRVWDEDFDMEPHEAESVAAALLAAARAAQEEK